MALSDEQIRLILNLGDSKKNVEEVRQALDAMGESVEKTDKKARASKSGIGAWTQEIQGLGRALQDFIQGGVGGVLNNIEQVFAKFPVLGAALTGLAAVLYAAWTPLTNWFKAWRDGVNEIPRIVGGLDKLNGELKTTKERLEGLAEKGFLSGSELTEYVGLLEKQAGIEKRIADEKERQAVFDKAKKEAAKGGLNAEGAEVAETIVNDMMGGADAARQQVGKNLLDRSQAEGRLGDIRRRQDADERARQAAEAAGQTTVEVDGPDGQKHYVDREKYFASRAKATMDAYRAELAKLGEEADKIVSDALSGDDKAAAMMASRFDPTHAREWLQATQAGRDRADAAEQESEAFAERARAGGRGRAANKREADLEAKADAHFEQQRRDWESNFAKMEGEARAKEKADAERLRNAVEAPVAATDFRDAFDAEREASEREMNGGFTSAENQALAKANQTEFRARSGNASQAEIERVLAENEARMHDIDASGGFGSAAYQAFVQTSAQLREVLAQIQMMQAQEQQFRAQAQSPVRTPLRRVW